MTTASEVIARPPRPPTRVACGDAPPRHPAQPPRLRQPQPAPRQDRDGRVRHGLHAGALQPGADRGAVDARHARQAGDRQGLPGGDPGASPTTRAGGARPGRRSRERQHLQAGPLRLSRAARATASRTSIGRWSPSSTSASGRGCPASATPGSTRCSRCPRRCSTRPWSTTSTATIRRASPTTPPLWEHIRECIDLAHRDGSIKTIVGADFPSYIARDEALAETLHKFRSSGKRLFLLTNSAWDYTSAMMSYLLDGAHSTEQSYPSWRHYFDVIVVERRQAGVLHRGAPVHRARRRGEPAAQEPAAARSSAGASTRAATSRTFQERARASGDRVLFVGDHIYGDMLRSRKSSNWRTAMVLQELEHEVTTHDRLRPEVKRASTGSTRELIHLDAELNERQSALRALQKTSGEAPDPAAAAASAPSRMRSSGCAASCARPPPSTASLEDDHRRRRSTPTGDRCSARATR